MSVASFIARVGVSPYFIAANAHCWFACVLVTIALHHMETLIVVPVALGLAALKEFWFDATYEVPTQTFFDNATDFAGYALGIGIALLRL